MSDENLSGTPMKFEPEDDDLLAMSPHDIYAEIRRLIEEPVSKSDLERALRAVREGHEERIKLAAMAVAQQRLGRILRQLATVERLEKELSDSKRLGPSAKTWDLIRALQYYSTEIYRALDFIFEQLSPEEIARPDFGFRGREQEPVPTISRTDREKIRRLIGEIADRLEQEFKAEESRLKVLPEALPKGREVG